MNRALLAAGLLALAGPVRAGDGVGVVVAVRGEITGALAGEAERPLTCGDVIREGERLTTGEASRVAVLSGDVYAQLFVTSAARFATGADGRRELVLERGRMRVIDPRRGSELEPVRVTTPRAGASAAGNDVDAYVLGPAAVRNSMVCAEGVDLEVARRDARGRSLTARPGRCAIVSVDTPAFTARVPSERIGLHEAYECELPIAWRLEGRLAPADVGAGPPGLLGLPAGEGDLGRDACDVPGSGCSGPFLEPGPAPVDTVAPSPHVPLPGAP